MTWRGENSCPYQDSNSNPSAAQPIVAIPTELSQLLVKQYFVHLYILLVHAINMECLKNSIFVAPTKVWNSCVLQEGVTLKEATAVKNRIYCSAACVYICNV
jgi:hypothetical protein